MFPSKIENVEDHDKLDTVYIYFSPCSHHTHPVWEMRRKIIRKAEVRRTEIRKRA